VRIRSPEENSGPGEDDGGSEEEDALRHVTCIIA
jgi:hypothetical protein